MNVSSLIVTVISTHALTEGDELLPACAEPAEKFQLTPSRRATITLHARLHFHFISTHALTEGDRTSPGCPQAVSYFNSRPHGGRPTHQSSRNIGEVFQLTPSRRATPSRVSP